MRIRHNVKEPRSRRAVFTRAFKTPPDCAEQLPSGSLARGRQRDPIHDVGLIMVFNRVQRPTEDVGAGYRRTALEFVRD